MTEHELIDAAMRGRVLYGPVHPVISPDDFLSLRIEAGKQRKIIVSEVSVFGLPVAVDAEVPPGEVHFVMDGEIVGKITYSSPLQKSAGVGGSTMKGRTLPQNGQSTQITGSPSWFVRP